MIHIAIDPGKAGGVAWGVPGYAYCEKMPETRSDLISLLSDIIGGTPRDCTAYIEKINGFIEGGGAGQMFEFGRQVERPGAILETLGVRIVEVTPQAWQKALGLGNIDKQRVPAAPRMPSPPRGSSPGQKREWKKLHGPAHRELVAAFKREHSAEIKSIKSGNDKAKRDWKNKLKAEAQRRFPHLSATLASSDALLILDYSFNPHPAAPAGDTASAAGTADQPNLIP